MTHYYFFFFFSSRRRHTRCSRDWSSDVCSSDLFQEMLARFKQGIDENIDEGDFQSHYDLGVAFKEMGLLDEAIAELQKALRAPDGKLRSSEALGVCFLDKGAYVVAESILRRALDL